VDAGTRPEQVEGATVIHETIITTRDEKGGDHIAPMGVREERGFVIVSPFRPSATLEQILREKCAVVNYTDDVRIFAGCLTGRYDWPTIPASKVRCNRLEGALAHCEVVLEHVEEEPQRPKLYLREVARWTHAPFHGFNRAQAAVIEAAILVSRLHMLPKEKVDSEMEYLSIAVGKTAGPRELEAWSWLKERIAQFRSERTESAV
jgi:hypothetical protein